MPYVAVCQDTSQADMPKPEKATIEWYATISSSNSENGVRFLKKMGNILFGSTPPLFKRPVSVFATDTLNIWIADQGNGEIVHTGISPNSKRSRFSQREQKISSLASLTTIGNGEVIFTDSSDGSINLRVDGTINRKLNGTMPLNQPTGIAYNNSTDEIWVLETKAHRVTVLDRNFKIIKSFGTRGTKPGEYNYPTHIWIDNDGKAFISDAMNHRIQVLNSSGEFEMEFGELGDATGYFARPKGVATDSRGNIYVADALFHMIQVFDKSGNFLLYFGGQGDKDGKFWMPNGICIDKDDFLYIADSYNSRIQIFKIEYR